MTKRPDYTGYDALAQDINLDDITSCGGNATILWRLQDGDTEEQGSLVVSPVPIKGLFIRHIDDEHEYILMKIH